MSDHSAATKFRQGQHLRVLFTANLPEDTDFADFPMDSLRVRLNPSYLVAQPEEVNHKHWQGYFEFPRKTSGNKIWKAFADWGITAYFTVAKGTAAANTMYCTKDDSCADKSLRYSHGEALAMPGQGARSDLNAMVDKLKENPYTSDLELLEMDPRSFMVHGKAFDRVRALLAPKRNWQTQLLVLCGPTGFGKTSQAMTLNPEKVRFSAGRFFNGYTGQNPTVLFDEFKWQEMPLETWLEITDRYPTVVEIKGGFINFAPRQIVFTHNTKWDTWYVEKDTGVQHPAVTRRLEEFGEVRWFGSAVPHTQKTLTNFFIKSPSDFTATATGTSATAGPSGATQDTEIIDLTQSDDEDDGQRDRFAGVTSEQEVVDVMAEMLEEGLSDTEVREAMAGGKRKGKEPAKQVLKRTKRAGGKPPRHP